MDLHITTSLVVQVLSQIQPVLRRKFLFIMDHQWYIKLYRKLLENPISYNIELLWFLSYLLLEVNHTEQDIYRGNQKIHLMPWERIISQRALWERFSISISKVHRFIKILEEENILEHQWSSSFTIVKLLNWDAYNWIETQTESKKNTRRTREETKQEWKQWEEWKEDISKDIWSTDLALESEKEYWNTEINQILLLLRQTVWCDDFTESQQWQRRYWKHFLNLWSKIWNDEFWKRLQWILSDKFKYKNCNSLKYLYDQMKSYIHSPVVEARWNVPRVW